MELGKLKLSELQKILNDCKGYQRDEVILKSSIGEDSSAIDLSKIKNNIMLISTDPITFTSKNIGNLAVLINSNDIYASGGVPFGVLVTILLPPNKNLEDISCIMEDIHKQCFNNKIQILGGHTEVTESVNEIVVSITILGTTSNKNFVRTSTSCSFDKIILTKTLGIEGTSILLDEHYLELKNILNEDEIKEGKSFSNKISIKEECEILREFKINSMHDITEGGIIGALLEMSLSSGKGFRIYKEKINVSKVTSKICKYFNIDVLRLISSGNLLFTCSDLEFEKIEKRFKEMKIEYSLVGEIISEEKYILNENGIDNEIDISIKDSFLD